MTAPDELLDRDRKLAALGACLADLGHRYGKAIRRAALLSIRRRRQEMWRHVRAERIELGWRDLGEAGA